MREATPAVVSDARLLGPPEIWGAGRVCSGESPRECSSALSVAIEHALTVFLRVGTCVGGGRGDHSGRNARECGGMSRALCRRRPRRAGSRPCHLDNESTPRSLFGGARAAGGDGDRDHFLEGPSGSSRDADARARVALLTLYIGRAAIETRPGVVQAAFTLLRWVGGLGDAPASALQIPK